MERDPLSQRELFSPAGACCRCRSTRSMVQPAGSKEPNLHRQGKKVFLGVSISSMGVGGPALDSTVDERVTGGDRLRYLYYALRRVYGLGRMGMPEPSAPQGLLV